MGLVFISYAHEDGLNAASKLRIQLEQAGHAVWRDIEDMHGGIDWKNQLGMALRQIDAVLVLLTPESVSSKYVEWEWSTALHVLQKRVIPILISKCEVPKDLAKLHYHDLSTDEGYILGLTSLLRDLGGIYPEPLKSDALKNTASHSETDTYTIIGGSQNAIGRNPLAINYGSVGDASELTGLLLTRIQQVAEDLHDEFSSVRNGLSIIYTRINQIHEKELKQLLVLVESGGIDQHQMQQTLEIVQQIVNELKVDFSQLKPDMKIAFEGLQKAVESNLGLQQKLELTLPVIPFFLDYKVELAAGSQVDLNSVWNDITNRWNILLKRITMK